MTLPRLNLALAVAVGFLSHIAIEPASILAEAKNSVAKSWPQLRGPNYDGHSTETGLINSIPPEGPPVLWTRPLGKGYSGFTAIDDRVYTQYQSLGGQYVICLEAATGKTRWEYRYDHPYDPGGLYPGPRGTPTLAHGRVYFSGPSGLVGCLDDKTGRLLWSVDVVKRFGAEPVEFGYSCSPTVIGDRVILPVGPPNATMVALDAKTGRTLWKSGDDAISHVPAFPIEWQGRQLIIGYLRNSIAAYDAKTGRQMWKKKRADGYDERASWPIYSSPYLWFAGPFQWGSELIELTDEARGYRHVWRSGIMSNDVSSSVLVDGSLYGFDIRDAQTKAHRPSRGQFRCIDLLTGQQHWANGSPGRRAIKKDPTLQPSAEATPQIGHASVLYADGKLILFNDIGELILARANPQQYEELGRVSVLGGELCWTQPTLFQGRLFVRNQSRAACLVLSQADAQSGHTDATLTVADIPQSTYRDWAAIILAVEPEYAMDLPSHPQLRLWFFVTLALWALAAAFAGLIVGIGALTKRRFSHSTSKRSDSSPSEPPLPSSPFRWIHFALALLLGAMGTTVLSDWSQQFIFTWPLCLFVALQATIYEAQARGDAPQRSVWRSRLILCAFLALSLAYFIICRRLSLAFEWTFLAGYVAAVPLLVLARRQSLAQRYRVLGELALAAFAYAAYYWASVGVLLWKY